MGEHDGNGDGKMIYNGKEKKKCGYNSAFMGSGCRYCLFELCALYRRICRFKEPKSFSKSSECQ